MITLRRTFSTALLLLAAQTCSAVEAPKTYPKGELGRMVKLGEEIALKTAEHPLTKPYVGNRLTCANCHLPGKDGKPGTRTDFSTWMGTATAFPAYTGREKTIQTLQDRSDNCFMRSMSGTRPPIDSKASLALAAYITWLSTGMPVKMNAKRACSPLISDRWEEAEKTFAALQRNAGHDDYLAGKRLFEQRCSVCHGQQGQGVGTFPPLWGKDADGRWRAYNAGAGMSKLTKAPAWVQANMPLGQGGTLSDKEAADIMLYVNAQPREDFRLESTLASGRDDGIYNAKVQREHDSVRSNFKALGLDVDAVRGDHIIP